MARTRLVAPTRVTQLALQTFDCRTHQLIQLGICRTVELEVAAEGIADFGFRSVAPGILTEHVSAAFSAKLVDPRPVMPRHGEDDVRLLDHVAGQQPGTMAGKVELV